MLEKDCMVLISIVLSSKWCRCWWTFAVNFDADSVCSLLLRALLSRYQVILKGWSPVVEVHIVWTLIPSWMSSPKLNGVMRGGTTQLKWGERERSGWFLKQHIISHLYSYSVPRIPTQMPCLIQSNRFPRFTARTTIDSRVFSNMDKDSGDDAIETTLSVLTKNFHNAVS